VTTKPDDESKFEALLDFLKRVRGFDFTGYKRPSLLRRIGKRMQEVRVEGFLEYIDYLEVHPEEFTFLFNTILINVTGFFRDPIAWEALAKVLAESLKGKDSDEPIRVWSAGCASGEEAYSLAITLAELLGEEEFRKRVKIYATDIDDEALGQARQAVYTAKDLEGLSEEIVNKYFVRTGIKFAFSPDLRRSVIFGKHNLIQDAPISKVDLLVCRNTIMYLNSETQEKVLSRLPYALNDDGILFLGRAETLSSQQELFSPIDLKLRLFRKSSRTERLVYLSDFKSGEEARVNVTKHVRLREAAFDSSAVAQLVVDCEGMLSMVNNSARSLFNIQPSDVGRPFKDMEIAYRPLELRPLIDQVLAEGRMVRVHKVERAHGNGQRQIVDVQAMPLSQNGNQVIGVAISFLDMTLMDKVQNDLLKSNADLTQAHQELQSAHEELETTNEELQSTNEELETTNEELQSTNEELETMNEELQSTNEELETMNSELRTLTNELDSSNNFLNSILSSLTCAVIVLDADLKVAVWNRRAEDLWGLRSQEVTGEAFLGLDVGLPVAELKEALRKFQTNEETSVSTLLEGINRRGRNSKCTVKICPLRGAKVKGKRGVVLLVDEE